VWHGGLGFSCQCCSHAPELMEQPGTLRPAAVQGA
jgi:hypothetical protein